MLQQDQLDKFRQQLTGRLRDLQTQLERNDHYGQNRSLQDSVGELSHYDNHPGDLGSEQFEREKDLALNEHTEHEIQSLEKALNRIDAGTYGLCEVCRKPIPLERLQALPVAARCVEHADTRLQKDDRPVEEDIMRERFQAGNWPVYDAEDAWQDVGRYGTSDRMSDDDEQTSLTPNDTTGSAQEIEQFLITDRKGHATGVNDEHEAYERKLDALDYEPAHGNSGLIDITEDDEDTDDTAEDRYES